MWIGRNTNLRDLIEAGAELPSGEGLDVSTPAFVTQIEADWGVFPRTELPGGALPPYSVFSVVSGDGGGYGDPLERDQAAITRDVANGLSSCRTASEVYGVVIGSEGDAGPVADIAATEQLREQRRRERLARAVPAREYKRQARERLLRGDLPAPARALYADVMRMSARWAAEFCRFWIFRTTSS